MKHWWTARKGNLPFWKRCLRRVLLCLHWWVFWLWWRIHVKEFQRHHLWQWPCSKGDGGAAGELHRRQRFTGTRWCSQVQTSCLCHPFLIWSSWQISTRLPHLQVYRPCSERPQHLPDGPPVDTETGPFSGGRTHPWCEYWSSWESLPTFYSLYNRKYVLI